MLDFTIVILSAKKAALEKAAAEAKVTAGMLFIWSCFILYFQSPIYYILTDFEAAKTSAAGFISNIYAIDWTKEQGILLVLGLWLMHFVMLVFLYAHTLPYLHYNILQSRRWFWGCG